MIAENDDGVAPGQPRGFTTPRLRAETLALKHADSLYPILAADFELYRHIPTEAPASLETVKTRFENLLVGRSADGAEKWLNWVLFGKECDSIVGTLEATVREHECCALIAYFIFKGHRRQGLGAEAVLSLVTWLFDTHASVESVKAYVDEHNQPSLGLVRKAGFRHIETLKDADFFDGSSRTEFVFDISRSEYNARIPES